MPSIIPGYEYDIFISYRQNDNKRDGWVTEFVKALQDELDATLKEKISIYFDENPYDGIAETHDVDESLAKKLKCLIFIPIISKTYCDPNSFAWSNEFLAFKKMAEDDAYGLKVGLPNGNTASRVLPIRIHDIDAEDKQLIQNEIGFLRSVDFVFNSSGVNRPLRTNEDDPSANLNKTFYRDQINKVANSIQEIVKGIKGGIPPEKKPVTPSSAANKTTPAKPVKKVKKGILLATTSVLFIAAITYFLISEDSETTFEEDIDKSIAVMPFDDISMDGDQQYFADGVMEDILTQLQKISEIRVTSRTSVEQYRDTDKAAPVIGEELNVSYLLEGSVRKAANQILVTAQLIRTNNDSHLWANNFTSEYSAEGLFKIQNQIATKIVEQLKLKISPEQLEKKNAQLTSNIIAYDFYRLAQSQYWKDLQMSIKTARQAIRADPKFTEAYGLLANAFAQNGYNEYPVLDLFDSSELYANKGIQLGNCSNCYTALAKVAETKYQNISQGITYDENAIQINPENGISTSNITVRALRIGDWETALRYTAAVIDFAKKRRTGNSQVSFILHHLAWLQYNMIWRDHLSASLDYFKAEKISFGGANQLSQLSTVYLALGDSVWFNKSIEAAFVSEVGDRDRKQYIHKKFFGNFWLEKDFQSIVNYYEKFESEILLIPTYDELSSMIAHSYWKLGFVEKAIKILKTSTSQPKHGPTKYFMFEKAMQSQYSGKIDEALDWVDKAIGSGYFFDLESDERIELLHKNLRFKELVAKQKQMREEVQAMAVTYNFPMPEDL